MSNLPQAKDFVKVNDGTPVTTSMQVAKVFGKRHNHVLRAIQNIECSPEFSSTHFWVHDRVIDIGKGATRKSKYYEMSKDGFIFLVMGFTGEKAAQFKEMYINAFNEMHEQLQQMNNGLIMQFNRALLEFEKFADLASSAGRTLSIVGKQLKPEAKARVTSLKDKIQPNLFIIDENDDNEDKDDDSEGGAA